MTKQEALAKMAELHGNMRAAKEQLEHAHHHPKVAGYRQEIIDTFNKAAQDLAGADLEEIRLAGLAALAEIPDQPITCKH